MGINYSIDGEARIVRLTYVGEVTIPEFEATITAVLRSIDYRPGFGFLSDRRRGKASTGDYVRGTAAFAKRHSDKIAGARWATVVDSPVNYGMARMAQNLIEAEGLDLRVDVFTDIAEAEAWLRKTDPER